MRSCCSTGRTRRHHLPHRHRPLRDGVTFTREDARALPSEDYETYGCEDPRIALIDGTYYLTYTGWDRRPARLCLATSTDLRAWTKHGPLSDDSTRSRPWTRAGSTGRRPGIVPQRMHGKWSMCFGEGAISWATSDDLILEAGHARHRAETLRTGTWDEALVEIGASVTDNGLLLFLTNGATRSVHDDAARRRRLPRRGRSRSTRTSRRRSSPACRSRGFARRPSRKRTRL